MRADKEALQAKKAIIFDMDGVIIDSEPLHEKASQTVFADFDVLLDDSVFAPFRGKTDRDIIEHLIEKHQIVHVTVEDLLGRKRDAYAELIDELQPIPGVMSFIHYAAVYYRLALTTSASRRNKELAFQKFNLHSFFEAVVTSNDISNPKPHPEPYLLTVEKLELTPEACLVIEDSTNGVRSAAAAGCMVAGVTTSFDEPALRDAGAHLVIETFDQLQALLD